MTVLTETMTERNRGVGRLNAQINDLSARLGNWLDGGVTERERGYLASIVETIGLQPDAAEISAIHSPLKIDLSDNTAIEPLTIHSIDLRRFGGDFDKKPGIEQIATQLVNATDHHVIYRKNRYGDRIWSEPPPSDVYHFLVNVDGKEQNIYYLTRRVVINGGLLVLGASVVAACGSLFRQRPTPELPPPRVTRLPDPTPKKPPTPESEIPTNFKGKIINANYLIDEGAKIKSVIDNNETEFTPQATAVPPLSSDQTKPVLSLPEEIDYAAKRWGEKELKLANSGSEATPLIDVVRYAVSRAVYRDVKGGVDYYLQSVNGNVPALAGLSLYRERLDFSNSDLPGEYIVEAGYPIGVNLKRDAGITVVGRSEDDNIVIAFEEYLPRGRVEEFHEPRIRFAVLTPQEFGNLSKELLLNLKYYTDTPNKLTYTDSTSGQDHEVEMNLITNEVMTEILKETEGHWREKYQDPESPTGYTLFPNPIVPLIPDELISELGLTRDNLTYDWWENPNLIGNPESVKLYARDPNTRYVIAVAKYNNSRKEWKWGEPGLRELADKLGLEIGALGDWYKVDTYEAYGRILEREFNLTICNWELGWYIEPNQPPLRPSRNEYNFSARLDKYIKWAEARKIRVQGQHLIDGNKSNIPEWLVNGNFTRDEILSIMEEHITKVASRYTNGGSYGPVHEWSVINELYATPWTQSFWIEKLGQPDLTDQDNWVAKAFRWANAANPNAKLFLNDPGIEFPSNTRYNAGRADRIYQVAKALKEADVPIHAVGFQMHLVASDFLNNQGDLDRDLLARRVEELKDNISRFQSIKNSKGENLEVIITEADLDMIRAKNGPWPMSPPLDQLKRFEIQAEILKVIYTACLDTGVKSFSFFGVTDEYSWAENPNSFGIGPDADPLLFDHYRPKPVYIALRNELQDRVASLA